MDTDDLAERIAPHLATLTHPGTDNTPPYPLVLGGIFGPYQLPENVTDADREELGIPAPELPRLFLEALYHLEETQFGITRIDATELADLRAAAAMHEGKRNAMKKFKDPAGNYLFRAMVKDFDTDEPIITADSLNAIRNTA